MSRVPFGPGLMRVKIGCPNCQLEHLFQTAQDKNFRVFRALYHVNRKKKTGQICQPGNKSLDKFHITLK